jgi:transmembrane sensor
MSDILEFNKRARVRDEASLWLTRLQEGLDASQQRALTSWLNADDAHENELLDLATIWDELEVLTELAPLFESVSTPHTSQTNTTKPHWSYTAWATGCIAASLLFGFGVYHFVSSPHRNEEIVASSRPSNTLLQQDSSKLNFHKNNSSSTLFKTAIGEQLELTLADGSIATLNTDTQIVVTFSAKQRVIQLLNGEAHFDVFTDHARPLKVLVSGKSVQAVGTAFSVRKKSGTDIEVAVDEGLVAVYQVKASSAKESVSALKASLDAGDVLTIADEQPQLIEYNLDEMEERLAWREGMIVINDETLDYVINEFERYSEQKVLLADRKMGETRVAGYFRLGDVDALLIALEKNFKIRSEYYQTTNTYVLSQL